MKNYLILLIVAITLETYSVYGQSGNASEQIEVRRFDHNVWKEVVGTTDYSEDKPAVKKKQDKNSKSSESSGKRFERSENDKSEDSEASGIPVNGLLLNIIAYALIIGVIGYILFLVIRNISLKPSGKITKTDSPDHSAPVENIKELEIDRLLKEAIAAGNYRLAIRIYFLGMLQKLDEDGFILWKKDKTNRDYLSELFSKEHYFEDVKKLTLAYEQVWYGEHNLSLEKYEQIILSFKAIDEKLKASKSA